MDVTFPEDWPEAQPDLRRLDRALRCSVCQDFLEGPVALGCGHACEFAQAAVAAGGGGGWKGEMNGGSLTEGRGPCSTHTPLLC